MAGLIEGNTLNSVAVAAMHRLYTPNFVSPLAQRYTLPALLPPAAQRYKRPDGFHQAERPCSLPESVGGAEHAGDGEQTEKWERIHFFYRFTKGYLLKAPGAHLQFAMALS
jgi:hypothetical protein